jgi:ATP-dependent phosphoenolpyruvate carboxykinase
MSLSTEAINTNDKAGESSLLSLELLLLIDKEILPPISRLNDEQAIAYYLAGYTAKIAGI